MKRRTLSGKQCFPHFCYLKPICISELKVKAHLTLIPTGDPPPLVSSQVTVMGTHLDCKKASLEHRHT